MAVLLVMSGHQVVQVFKRLGWQVAGQRGSHIILVEPEHAAPLSVLDHREVAKGTLRNLVRAAGLAPEAFIDEADRS